jgi:hypothetical protein
MPASLIQVVFICPRHLEARDAGAGINQDIDLHAEVPLIPFFVLVHLWRSVDMDTLASFVLSRAGGFNDDGINK